jgi:hypothetical protein
MSQTLENLKTDSALPEIANLSKPVETIVAPTPAPTLSELGIDQTQTIGIVCSPTELKNLISMISLPKKPSADFPKIVLNFEEDRVWWGNSLKGSFFMVFGFATADSFEQMWGKGSVPISVPKFLERLELLRSYPEVTFWVNLKTKIYGLQAENVLCFTSYIEAISEITSAYYPEHPNVKQQKFPIDFLENGYIPRMKTEENAFVYGIDTEASELKTIITLGAANSRTSYPISISSKDISVNFNEANNPKETGSTRKRLIAKPGSEQLPTDEKSINLIIGPTLESLADNLKGPITLRFGKTPKSPVYVLHKTKNEAGGVIVAGFTFSGKESDATGK